MATSPIYNWPEPDNTDLVRNGALAIRTLGNAIDTTMATMVAKTIVDAKGDLIAGTAADTAARLPVGANGETLVVDASTATGLRYNPQNVLANPIINGGFDIWQRGTSFSYTASTNAVNYNADRFQGGTGVNQASTISRQLVGDTTNLPNLQYCLRWQRNSGQTGTGGMAPSTSIETANSIPFAGKVITYSFYARKGADFSAASSELSVRFVTGTGTDQNVQNGLTGQTSIISSTATLTTTWQRFAYTATVGVTATQMAAFFIFTPTGTAGAADYFEVTGLQIDVGTYTASTAPTFRRAGATIQGELAACQRYFQVITAGATTGFNSTTQTALSVVLPPMRISGITFALTAAFGVTDLFTADFTQSSANITTNINNGVNGAVLSFGNFTGLTAYRAYSMRAAGQITASAEL